MQASVSLTDTSDDPISFDLAVGSRWIAENREGDTRFSATIELRGMKDVTPDLTQQGAVGFCRYLVDRGTIVDELPDFDSDYPIVGDDTYSRQLGDAGSKVTAIEIDAGKVAKAKEYLSNGIDVRLGAAEDLPVGANSQDLAYLFFPSIMCHRVFRMPLSAKFAASLAAMDACASRNPIRTEACLTLSD